MKILFTRCLGRGILILATYLFMPLIIKAQTYPTATELASQMTIGWNLGNSLEVPDGETAWGNPATTQELIDAVKAAGFNTVRIPCAWDSYADATTYEISSTWFARVKEVVDYCINNDMYVIINIHWDGGWLEENPLYDSQDEVNEKQDAYWTQIANYFIDYDEHLLFAGTNEVHADYNSPSDENIEVQESFNQTFVDAVRATGGNNSYRNLIVQTYNTNAWYGLSYFTLPDDEVEDRLFVEIHHYDPYDFTLNSDDSSACILWGTALFSSNVCSWGQEDYVDDLFAQLKSTYVDQGAPVIMGEYGVGKRTNLTGSDYTDHITAREYYLEYVTNAAKENGIVPVYWDNGYDGNMGFALFDRSSGDVVDHGALDALMAGAGVTEEEDDDETVTATLTKHGAGSSSQSIDLGDAITDFYYSWTDATSVTVTGMPDGIDITIDESAMTVAFSGTPTETGTFSFTVTTVDADVNATTGGTITVNSTGDGTTTTYCDDPESATLPLSIDGDGTYCYVVTESISYVNSWGLSSLTINGVDYANTWSNSMPDMVDGAYYISYSGSYGWSHFEATALKSAKVDSNVGSNSEQVKIFPNPFTSSEINIELNGVGKALTVNIYSLSGQFMYSNSYEIDDNSSLTVPMPEKGKVFIIKLITDNGVITQKVMRK